MILTEPNQMILTKFILALTISSQLYIYIKVTQKLFVVKGSILKVVK